MRKLSIFAALICFAVFLLSLPCAAVVLINDSFEDYSVGENPPEPWEPLVRADGDKEMFLVDDSKAFDGSKCLRVDKPSNWASFGALFESEARVITYELRGYTEIDDLRTLIMIMASEDMAADNDDAKANYVAYMGSGFVEYHDGAWNPVAAYDLKTWHHIACEVDLDAQSYKIFIDDMNKAAAEGCNFWHPVEKLSYAIVRGSPQGGSYWVDSVFVYEGRIGTEKSQPVEPVGKMTGTWGLIKAAH